jgi:[ribosomal protein S5]-alanine N-acetyltransferase
MPKVAIFLLRQSIYCPTKFKLYLAMHLIAQTKRITIREYLPNELETYLNHFTDKKVALYIPKRSRDERINIFNNAFIQYQTTKTNGMWGMFNNTDEEFIGGCLLRPFHGDPNLFEIGYSLNRKYWGQGLATEMVEALVKYSFTTPNITAIVACTQLPNLASQRVLEKAGFMRGENIVEEDGLELAFFTLSR